MLVHPFLLRIMLSEKQTFDDARFRHGSSLIYRNLLFQAGSQFSQIPSQSVNFLPLGYYARARVFGSSVSGSNGQ